MWHLAIKDLLQTPLKAALTWAALFTLTALTLFVSIMGDALSSAVDLEVITQPAVVVSRSDGAPVPIEETSEALADIPGVLAVWPRFHDRVRPLPRGTANDVALDVFQEASVRALLPEIQAALPWPAVIITRADREGVAKTRISHRAANRLLLFLPSLFALLLMVSAFWPANREEQRAFGILKALGWTSADIIRRHLIRTMVITGAATVPAWIAGALAAVFINTPTVHAFLLGPGASLQPPVTAATVLSSIVAVAGLIAIPFASAAMVPAFRAALTEPGLLLTRGHG